MTADPADVRRVLILSPNWLGDAIMALPAIADVRRRFPDARLAVAARKSVADLFHLIPDVNDVVVLDRDEVSRLKEQKADVAILLPNSFTSAWLTRRAGIAQRWGYAADFRSPILTRAIRRPKRSVHQAEYYQHLVRQLGFPSGPLQPSLVVPDEATAGARQLLAARGCDGSRAIVVIAPGAAYGTAKRWLPTHYASLVTQLVTGGVHCVLVGSSGDRETTQWIVSLVTETTRAQVIDLSGATTLAILAGVIKLAGVFVSNDSGAMHVASAIGTPVVAIFGPTREYETRPLARQGARAEVLIHPVWCRPCMLRECPIDHRCMKGLTPDRVLSTVRELMS